MPALTFRRVKMEDLKGAPQWVSPLLTSLNLFMEQCTNIINGQLTVGSNINGMTNSQALTVPSGYPTKFNTFSFQYTGKSQPTTCVIGAITDQSGATITSPTSIQWYYNSNVTPPAVTITYVAGLTAGHTYNITLAVS